MPSGMLFAAASFPPQFLPDRHAPAVESNIRMCDFFLQIFGERQPHPAYASFISLALECCANPAMPMRRIAVLFRNPPEADPQLRELRQTLCAGGQCDVGEFRDRQELDARVQAILADWYGDVSAPGNPNRSQ